MAGLIASAILIPGCTIPACDVIDDHGIRIDAKSYLFVGYSRVDVGDPITVSASWDFKDNFDNSATEGRFDLDGNGTFETQTPTGLQRHSVTHTYDSEQTVAVSHLLEATGTNFFTFRDRSVAQTTFTVDDPETRENVLPLGCMSSTPNPARVNQTVTFTSCSKDFDGSVVQHDWDLDGNGTYELIDAPTSVTTSYPEPGSYGTFLRVTDEQGGVGFAGPHPMQVIDYHDIKPVSGDLATAAAVNPETLALDVSGKRRSEGTIFLNGGELVEVGGTARGRFPADQLPIPLQRRNLKVRWAARFNSSMDISSESTNAFGVILFDYPAGGMSCLGFETEAPAGEEPTGFFRVIGGAGKGATIRGQGTGTAALDTDGIIFSGAGELRRGQPFQRLGKNGCPSLRDEVRRRPENSRAAG